MTWRLSLVGLAAASVVRVTTYAQTPAPPNPVLDDLVSKAAAYVDRYYEAMSRLTFDERYVQDIVVARVMSPMPPGRASAPSRPTGEQQRVLRSECIVLRVGPPFEWRFYRNVFEVDGLGVKDRNARLVTLLQQPAESAVRAAERIAEESARYNISNVGRVLNEPALPFVFLRDAVRSRVQLTLQRREDNVWIVAFTEHGRPSLFRHNRTLDNPSSGRFWIDASTGEVQRAEHVVSPFPLKATFTTVFRHDARFGVAVPHEMRELLSTGPEAAARRVSGVATYENYREFRITAG
ncbi:MAG: hypothetical protein IT184_04995 [Acidobacteria bacterium]|nr:hypothetical protein [Acidobacteriota bacterium]